MTQSLTSQDIAKVETLPLAWNGSMCDECGIIAIYTASKENAELNFCGHHLRKHADKLVSEGFSITPEAYKL
jgi:hypothetical protein